MNKIKDHKRPSKDKAHNSFKRDKRQQRQLELRIP